MGMEWNQVTRNYLIGWCHGSRSATARDLSGAATGEMVSEEEAIERL